VNGSNQPEAGTHQEALGIAKLHWEIFAKR